MSPNDLAFLCPCDECKKNPNRPGLSPPMFALIRSISTLMIEELEFTSGRRCDTHNAAVGGSVGSRHLSGEAVDIKTGGNAFLARRIIDAAVLERAPCIEVCPFHIHVDVRDMGRRILLMGKSG